MRILARYIEPDARFREFNACYTIVFFDLAHPLFEGDSHRSIANGEIRSIKYPALSAL